MWNEKKMVLEGQTERADEQAETAGELIRQINEISEAILKCEKMLQHMALGDYGNQDFNETMSQHIRLKSTKERLGNNLAKLREQENNVTESDD